MKTSDKKFAKVLADPAYIRLVRVRNTLAWSLGSVVFIAYFAFILTIAFKPKLLAIPIAATSPITWGLPAGLGLILLSFIMTGVYAFVANHIFDELAKDVHENI